MESELARIYGNRVRIRVCGICWIEGKLLMVNHRIAAKGDFWAPAGGGLEFGEAISDRLVQEFREEANLEVAPGAFLFGCEFRQEQLHAIELFFEVRAVTTSPATGFDPELQIIKEARLMSPEEIQSLPPESVHGIFRICRNPLELTSLKGFYTL